MLHGILRAVAIASSAFLVTAQDEPARDATFTRAIVEMRNLPPKLVGREAEERGPRIQAAWETLIAAKDAGVAALLAEASRLDAAKQRDDRFRLGAAAVVWEIGHFDRVADIVALWGDADFEVKYDYAFRATFEAAYDGDERALPMLVALLRDQRGSYFVANHVMNIVWPLTHEFLWGPMGRKAVPALRNVLATAKDATVLSSAIELLAFTWDTESMPNLRAIARDAAHGARRAAVEALGRFGHPDDFDALTAGITADDTKVASAHVLALCHFGDLRAVPLLIPLTKHADQDLRSHALHALGVLATVEGLEVFDAGLADLDTEHGGWFAYGPSVFHSLEETWDDYRKLTRAARGEMLAKARARAEAEFVPREGDRQLTRPEFESACAAWIEASRIVDEEHEWIEARHVLAVAKPADIPLLLDLRGRLFRRLSDECLEEVATVSGILRRLVRSQYRKEPGVCEQVEAVPATNGKEK